ALRGRALRGQPGGARPPGGTRPAGGAEQRQCRPAAHRPDARVPLPAGRARARRGQARRQHLPRCLRPAGMRTGPRAARRRRRRDGRARCATRRPAHLLDQPPRWRRPRARLAARRRPPRPGSPRPGGAGRPAGCIPRPQGTPMSTTQDPNPTQDGTPRPLHLVTREELAAWRGRQPRSLGQWMEAHRFDAAAGTLLVLPGDDGIGGAVLGVGDLRDPYGYAQAPFALPEGDWRVEGARVPDGRRAGEGGWGLGSYRDARYRKPLRAPARLVLDAPDAEPSDILEACLRVRELVNTPTEHMGPEQLHAHVEQMAEAHGARFDAVVGDDLLAQDFPAIHAVGRASHRAARLLRLEWGDASHPRLAIVGKGVCFDTGGLNIKGSDGMRNMKKDMGGGAHA